MKDVFGALLSNQQSPRLRTPGGVCNTLNEEMARKNERPHRVSVQARVKPITAQSTERSNKWPKNFFENQP